MLLYHCFSRKREGQDSDAHSLRVLELILTYGLLCSHERVRFGLDPSSERYAARMATGKGHEVDQSRICFTLLNREELTKKVDRTPTAGTTDFKAHTDIFGEIAIGLDPVEARQLGVMPTSYFYDSVGGDRSPGVSAQIAYRLGELQTLCAVLAKIEARVGEYKYRRTGASVSFPNHAELSETFSISTEFEPEIEARLRRLGKSEAKRLFEYFNTDRVRAADLHDFLNMMLAAYQSTDNPERGAHLEFFLQREWRIIFHNRFGLEWFSLHNSETKVNTWRQPSGVILQAREAMRTFINEGRTVPLPERFFEHCWVLAAADGRHVRQFIREVVTPARLAEGVSILLSTFGLAHLPVVTYS